jgi:hypothetical protein
VRTNGVEWLTKQTQAGDLFGVGSRPADKFPADGGGGAGFDNNASTLFIPPILMEKYLVAADDILNEANPERIFIARPGGVTSKRSAARKIVDGLAKILQGSNIRNGI